MTLSLDKLRDAMKQDDASPERKEFEAKLRDTLQRAFLEATLIKYGSVEWADVAEFSEGNIDQVVERLQIQTEFTAALERILENKRVNDAMDAADEADKDGEYVDLDDIIARHPVM